MNVGKPRTAWVDLVARKQDDFTYIQVTAYRTAEETFRRKTRPLRAIRDNDEKLVLMPDRFSMGNAESLMSSLYKGEQTLLIAAKTDTRPQLIHRAKVPFVLHAGDHPTAKKPPKPARVREAVRETARSPRSS